MKVFNKLLIALLILTVFAASSEINSVALVSSPSAAVYTAKDITLQPGSNESMMNFCWYSNAGNTRCYVQISKKADMTGNMFPSSAVSFSGTLSTASTGFLSNKVTVTGLLSQTEYVYRVGNGTAYSEIYSFKTGDSSSFHAIFLSDAQIGASTKIDSDKVSWEKTLSSALGKVSNASFILSGGDQVDYFLESEYDAFLASPLLRSVPIAPTVGNHENLSSSPLNSYHYYEPNESSQYGITPAGGDYWFRYGSALFIVLNTNNSNVKEHDAFIGQAKAANSDSEFTVLMYHQSIYSSATYSAASSTVTLRNNLYPIIDKYDIDIVLSGHDHCYTRTYQMLGGAAQKAQSFDSQGRVVNPTGTVYITAGSASGSKYYDMKKTPESYSAIRLQLYTPTFSDISVSGGSLTITTYRVDTMKAIDTYTIVKNNTSRFIDVPDSAWYKPAVDYISEKNITTGTGSNTFSPNAPLTRAQFIVMLMKAYGLSPEASYTDNFSDAGNTYYTDYLAAAKHLGIVQGAGSNTFLPNNNISRQDMFTMLYNALIILNKLPAESGNGTAFSDSNQIAAYAQKAVSVLSGNGIISGSAGRIYPTASSTRCQMAQLLYNLQPK